MTIPIGSFDQPGWKIHHIIDGESVLVEKGPDLPVTIEVSSGNVNILQKHGNDIQVVTIRAINVFSFVELLRAAHYEIAVRD